MLEIGNGGMTPTEYRTHMSLWWMLAAPLIAGNDLRNMTPEISDILTNKEIIAIDQDSSARQGTARQTTANSKSGRSLSPAARTPSPCSIAGPMLRFPFIGRI